MDFILNQITMRDNRALRSNYSAKLVDDILVIVDQGTGTDLSVTNNIENVVEACLESFGKTKDEIPYTVYEDSDGEWDGWDNRKEDFVLLMAQGEAEAIHELKKRTS